MSESKNMGGHEAPDANIDPGAIIQGHAGQKQTFSLERSLLLADPKTKRPFREFLLKDNFENLYLVYRCKLSDGEVWDVPDWVRPSVMQMYGGFTDALIDEFRAKALNAFREAELEIKKARALANQLFCGAPIDGAKLMLNPGRN